MVDKLDITKYSGLYFVCMTDNKPLIQKVFDAIKGALGDDAEATVIMFTTSGEVALSIMQDTVELIQVFPEGSIISSDKETADSLGEFGIKTLREYLYD